MDLAWVTDEPSEAVKRVVDCYQKRCSHMPAEPEKADAQ
jgi:hypothetical protein